MVRSRLGSGRWIRLLDSDVFALPSHPGTWHRQAMAATLSVPGSALSGPAAAALHGFEGWPRAHLEVCTRHGGTNRSAFATVRQTRTVGRLVVVDGIRAASAADCVVQLAPGLDVDGISRLIDVARQGRRSVLAELRDRHVALASSRMPGIADLGEALARRDDDVVAPRNDLERRARSLVAAVGPPSVEYEAMPPWLEPHQQRVDALIPPWRLVVEVDGRAWHTRLADFEHDRWRDAEALAHGYATLRLTWFQLVHRPTWCRNVLQAIAARRSG